MMNSNEKENKNRELLNKFGVFQGTNDPAMEKAFKEIAATYLSASVRWEITGNSVFPFKADVNGQTWKIRINNFPDEPLNTLLIDDKPVITFDNLPKNWKLPEDTEAKLKTKLDLLSHGEKNPGHFGRKK